MKRSINTRLTSFPRGFFLTGSRSLKEIALLKVCTLYKRDSTELECLPKTLKYETEECREKYFWTEAAVDEKREAENSDTQAE